MTARRGRGEGSITKRNDGRWVARIGLGRVGGKRRYKSIYGHTRREVAEALPAALRAAQQGFLKSDERERLGAFLNRWLSDVARVRVRSRTFATYEAAISLHITPYIGGVPVARLTPQHLQTWLADLERAGVSPGRRRYGRAVLRAALNTALRWEIVSRNVATLVDGPRSTSREIRSLTPDEARKLLSAAADGPLHGFVAVALGAGLRLGEALGLRWQDVDLDAGALRVRMALQRAGGDPTKRRPLVAERRSLLRRLGTAAVEDRPAIEKRLGEIRDALKSTRTTVQLAEPKSARSCRTIVLPNVTIAALKAHRVRQLEQRLAAGPAWEDRGFMFTTPIGSPCDVYNIHKPFKALLASAGLPHMRIHDLRHSCASLLLAKGVDPRTIMETLGHSQISLTLNTYAHVLPTLKRDAATKMDAVLGKI